MTSGDLSFDVSEKKVWNIFEMIFDNGSNNVFCFGLSALGAELEGGVQTPPQSGEGNAEAQWGAG